MPTYSESPMLGEFLKNPSVYKGETLTGSDVTARTFPKKRSELMQKVLTALNKRCIDNSKVVKACEIASLKSWPVYSQTNETERSGI